MPLNFWQWCSGACYHFIIMNWVAAMVFLGGGISMLGHYLWRNERVTDYVVHVFFPCKSVADMGGLLLLLELFRRESIWCMWLNYRRRAGISIGSAEKAMQRASETRKFFHVNYSSPLTLGCIVWTPLPNLESRRWRSTGWLVFYPTLVSHEQAITSVLRILPTLS